MKAWLVVGLLLIAGAAQAMPLKVRNGSSLRVAVHGKRESGVGLRMKDKGWRLELAATVGGDEAEAVDVTDGAHESRWAIEVRDGALVFDGERFVAGHAYRLTVRRGGEERGSALIYLYPPTVSARTSQVSFDDAPAPGGDDDDALLVSKKPTL